MKLHWLIKKGKGQYWIINTECCGTSYKQYFYLEFQEDIRPASESRSANSIKPFVKPCLTKKESQVIYFSFFPKVRTFCTWLTGTSMNFNPSKTPISFQIFLDLLKHNDSFDSETKKLKKYLRCFLNSDVKLTLSALSGR